MPKLTVHGFGTCHVPKGKRLVLALDDDAGIEPLHTCGGTAGCSTCRVRFLAGEPSRMTVAEKKTLDVYKLTGVRLSCQILCEHDMAVMVIRRIRGFGRQDNRPAPELRPLPVEWIEEE